MANKFIPLTDRDGDMALIAVAAIDAVIWEGDRPGLSTVLLKGPADRKVFVKDLPEVVYARIQDAESSR